MRYTEADIHSLTRGDEEDSNVPDRVEDIKPRFHRARTQGLDGASAQIAAALAADDDEDGGGGGDDGDDSSTEWNLR
jgi:transportin-1